MYNAAEDLALLTLDELISCRLLLEAAQLVEVRAYTFAHDMLHDMMCRKLGRLAVGFFTDGV